MRMVYRIAASLAVFAGVELVYADTRVRCSLLFTTASVAEEWLANETPLASTKILENISPPDGLPGSIIAARTRVSPNYYYHWIRDAGLVIEALVERYQSSNNSNEKSSIRRKVFEYLEFSKTIQNIKTLSGLGEPKVNVDGTSFNDEWGRPQNDSPALRAISLISLTKRLDQPDMRQLIRDHLYDSKLPSNSVIKRDLEYIAHQWRNPSWDIWEEVSGAHFYTRMVQRRALLDGAQLASLMGDGGAAAFYRHEAHVIELSLHKFWDKKLGYIRVTLTDGPYAKDNSGLDNKHSGLDIAVILGLLHGSRNDGFMRFNDPRVLATLERIETTFAKQYSINQRPDFPGVAIGRYPEDAFSGADRSGGNPWVLATLAMAEAYYRAAEELKLKVFKGGDQSTALKFIAKGDAFVARVKLHSHADGSLNEQMDRTSGYMHSVSDLTWSYAAVLTAHAARERAVR